MSGRNNPAQAGSILAFRSDLARTIRRYFESQGVLEVTTPLLRNSGSSEVHLTNLLVESGQGDSYLQTSPEHAMKCLLAQYSVSIFQICPAFRGGEIGNRHRTEFQMLEWYRCDFSLAQLMDDVVDLLDFLQNQLARESGQLSLEQVRRVPYRELFESRYALNPHELSEAELRALPSGQSFDHLQQEAQSADYFDALFATSIEPGLQSPTIVYDYPACQSALAETKITHQGDLVSDRFELYIDGIEIANAYQELTDAGELKRRFDSNNQLRRKLGKPLIPDDEALIAAVEKMNRCAGIALGVDRLAMVLSGVKTIDEVIP